MGASVQREISQQRTGLQTRSSNSKMVSSQWAADSFGVTATRTVGPTTKCLSNMTTHRFIGTESKEESGSKPNQKYYILQSSRKLEEQSSSRDFDTNNYYRNVATAQDHIQGERKKLTKNDMAVQVSVNSNEKQIRESDMQNIFQTSSTFNNKYSQTQQHSPQNSKRHIDLSTHLTTARYSHLENLHLQKQLREQRRYIQMIRHKSEGDELSKVLKLAKKYQGQSFRKSMFYQSQGFTQMNGPDAISRLHAPMTRAHISWEYEFGRTHGGKQLLKSSIIRHQREQHERFGETKAPTGLLPTRIRNTATQKQSESIQNQFDTYQTDKKPSDFFKTKKLLILTKNDKCNEISEAKEVYQVENQKDSLEISKDASPNIGECMVNQDLPKIKVKQKNQKQAGFYSVKQRYELRKQPLTQKNTDKCHKFELENQVTQRKYNQIAQKDDQRAMILIANTNTLYQNPFDDEFHLEPEVHQITTDMRMPAGSKLDSPSKEKIIQSEQQLHGQLQDTSQGSTIMLEKVDYPPQMIQDLWQLYLKESSNLNIIQRSALSRGRQPSVVSSMQIQSPGVTGEQFRFGPRFKQPQQSSYAVDIQGSRDSKTKYDSLKNLLSPQQHKNKHVYSNLIDRMSIDNRSEIQNADLLKEMNLGERQQLTSPNTYSVDISPKPNANFDTNRSMHNQSKIKIQVDSGEKILEEKDSVHNITKKSILQDPNQSVMPLILATQGNDKSPQSLFKPNNRMKKRALETGVVSNLPTSAPSGQQIPVHQIIEGRNCEEQTVSKMHSGQPSSLRKSLSLYDTVSISNKTKQNPQNVTQQTFLNQPSSRLKKKQNSLKKLITIQKTSSNIASTLIDGEKIPNISDFEQFENFRNSQINKQSINNQNQHNADSQKPNLQNDLPKANYCNTKVCFFKKTDSDITSVNEKKQLEDRKISSANIRVKQNVSNTHTYHDNFDEKNEQQVKEIDKSKVTPMDIEQNIIKESLNETKIYDTTNNGPTIEDKVNIQEFEVTENFYNTNSNSGSSPLQLEKVYENPNSGVNSQNHLVALHKELENSKKIDQKTKGAGVASVITGKGQGRGTKVRGPSQGTEGLSLKDSTPYQSSPFLNGSVRSPRQFAQPVVFNQQIALQNYKKIQQKSSKNVNVFQKTDAQHKCQTKIGKLSKQEESQNILSEYDSVEERRKINNDLNQMSDLDRNLVNYMDKGISVEKSDKSIQQSMIENQSDANQAFKVHITTPHTYDLSEVLDQLKHIYKQKITHSFRAKKLVQNAGHTNKNQTDHSKSPDKKSPKKQQTNKIATIPIPPPLNIPEVQLSSSRFSPTTAQTLYNLAQKQLGLRQASFLANSMTVRTGGSIAHGGITISELMTERETQGDTTAGQPASTNVQLNSPQASIPIRPNMSTILPYIPYSKRSRWDIRGSSLEGSGAFGVGGSGV